MGKKKDTYIAGQTLHNRVEFDQNGNRIITQKVIYEQREFIDGYTDVRLPIKHKFGNGGFITVFQDALQTIVQYGKLSKSETSLLLWLIATAGVDGSVNTNLVEIEEVLSISKSMVSRALKGLVLRNIVIRRDGNRFEREPLSMELSFNYDQLNYNLAYNGKTAKFKEKKSSHPAIAVPGGRPGEWVDSNTGECTFEVNGTVQYELPFGEKAKGEEINEE